MSMQDSIADMFIRIKNGQAVTKEYVAMPASKIKTALAKLLKDEGYIKDYQLTEQDGKATLLVFLKYYRNKPVIEMLKRVSRPGIRIYRACTELPKVVGGLGIAIISTPKGLMTDRAARAAGQGGEVIGVVA